jgi:hypothetical protein
VIFAAFRVYTGGMADQSTSAGKGTAKTYPRRLPAYDNDEGARLAQELARRRGTSVAALLRMLIREEAKREGIE